MRWMVVVPLAGCAGESSTGFTEELRSGKDTAPGGNSGWNPWGHDEDPEDWEQSPPGGAADWRKPRGHKDDHESGQCHPERRQFWDEDPEATARAVAILAQMTLEEKIDMLHGELNNLYGFYNAPIPRLGIPALYMADGRNGVRLANPALNNQRSTLLPAAIAVAASFDENVIAGHSFIDADETFRTGQNSPLAPALNIARVAQNGRVFESFGEDPLVQGRAGTTYVLTAQDYGGILSNIQDWAVYTQEWNRLEELNNIVGERAFQEIYTRPFEATIRNAHPGSVMCGFNQVNGEYSCDSNYLLNIVLKTQLEFEGWVLTDYNAVTTTLGINNGLDQQQPGNTDPSQQPGSCLFCQPLLEAVQAGQVPISRVNDAVLRILRPMIGLGLFDRSYQTLPIDEAGHNAESAALAAQSMVLLKNAGGVLPLSPTLGSIAVIGTDADTVVQGAGSSHIEFPTSETSPLAGIQARVSPATNVTFVPGTDPVTAAAFLPGAQPIPSSFLQPVSGTGTGLTAQYYLNQDFSGTPYIDRVDPYVGLNAGFFIFEGLNANSPHFPSQPSALNGNISIRWSGSLVAPVTGNYELQVVTNGVTRLFIDGNLVINEPDFYTPTPEAPNQTLSVTLPFAAGSTHSVVLEFVFDTSSEWNQADSQIKLGWVPPPGIVLPQAAAAAAAAAQADAAVILVRDYSGEGADRPSLLLPNWQPELIRAVGAANPNTVVVMTTGGAVRVVDWQDAVSGIIQAWYPGQNQGTAIASVLFGDVNPSGKLPITNPVDIDQTPISTPQQYPGVTNPANGNTDVTFSEGIFEGYRGYLQFGIEPSYPFGYGLSYTTFELCDLAVKCKPYAPTARDQEHGDYLLNGCSGKTERDHCGDTRHYDYSGKDKKHLGYSCKTFPLQVAVKVTNTGSVAGAEVVQAYAGQLDGIPVPTPQRALAGWSKVYLQPGESRVVTIPLSTRSFSYWDEVLGRWVTPPGNVPVYVGTSVVNTPLTTSVRILPTSEI